MALRLERDFEQRVFSAVLGSRAGEAAGLPGHQSCCGRGRYRPQGSARFPAVRQRDKAAPGPGLRAAALRWYWERCRGPGEKRWPDLFPAETSLL